MVTKLLFSESKQPRYLGTSFEMVIIYYLLYNSIKQNRLNLSG